MIRTAYRELPRRLMDFALCNDSSDLNALAFIISQSLTLSPNTYFTIWIVSYLKAHRVDQMPPKQFKIEPPLLNTACPWATTLEDLASLYNCPHTGAITIRTSRM